MICHVMKIYHDFGSMNCTVFDLKNKNSLELCYTQFAAWIDYMFAQSGEIGRYSQGKAVPPIIWPNAMQGFKV